MTDREQYAPGPASGAQFRRFWSAHVDALERHLDRMNLDLMDPDRMDQTPTKRKTKTTKNTTRPKPRT